MKKLSLIFLVLGLAAWAVTATNLAEAGAVAKSSSLLVEDDPSSCQDGKNCKGCGDEPSRSKSSCTGKKPVNLFAWMTENVVESGVVFSKLELTDKQKVALKGLLTNNSKKVLDSVCAVFRSCGECPISAICTQKYKGNDAACLCVSSEVALLVDKPLHKEIKSILTKGQYKKYKEAVTLLGDYSKQARALMKAGEKGEKKLAKLHGVYRKKLDKVLPVTARKVAKQI